jgi:hypothetical protein
MDVTSEDTAELDKDRFVREIDQSVREHGHQFLFAVEQGGIVRDLIKDHHLFSVEDIVLAMKLRTDPTTLGPERLDPYERDDIDFSHTLVEAKLSPTMRKRIRVRYDHLDDFFDLPGSVIFMMSLDICDASQSFDIEGALENLERLTLDDYPGEDVTECGAIAQKYVKSMQGGYALPVKTGSKILYKFTKTSCEEFNQKSSPSWMKPRPWNSCTNYKIPKPWLRIIGITPSAPFASFRGYSVNMLVWLKTMNGLL